MPSPYFALLLLLASCVSAGPATPTKTDAAFRLGPAGEHNGWAAHTSFERARFDLKQESLVSLPMGGPNFAVGPRIERGADLSRAHGIVSYTTERLSFAGLVGGATIASGRWAEDQPRGSIGARIAGHLIDVGPIATAASLQLTNNESRASVSSLRSRAKWLEADARLTARTQWRPTDGTAPSPWALSPYAGAAYRHLDGYFQLSNTATKPELSADLVYGILGLDIEWRFAHANLALTAEGMLGEVSGLQFTLAVRF